MMKKRILIIGILLWAGVAFAVKVVPLPQLMAPDAIQANTDNLYFSDGSSVKIFSLKDFKLKKTFGKKGEGPGEFNGFILVYVMPEYIFINSPGKVSYFTLEGEFIREKRAKHPFGRFKTFGETDFVGYGYTNEGKTRYEAIYIYDSDFKRVKELYRRKYFVQRDSDINLIEERPPFFYTVKDRVYLDGIDNNAGVIYVFDKTGKKIDAVRCPFEPIPFTQEHIKKSINRFKRNPDTRRYYEQVKHRLVFPDYFPPIRMFHVDDNKIYLMTYKEKDGKNEFIVLDMKGKELNRLFIPVAPFDEATVLITYTICNGKLYHLKDNEETEEWEVHIHNIAPAARGTILHGP